MFLRRTSLKTLRVKTLARTRMSTGSATFATTHRVIDRVHHYATVARTTTKPTRAAGLSAAFERMLAVAYNAYRSLASGENLAGFA